MKVWVDRLYSDFIRACARLRNRFSFLFDDDNEHRFAGRANDLLPQMSVNKTDRDYNALILMYLPVI